MYAVADLSKTACAGFVYAFCGLDNKPIEMFIYTDSLIFLTSTLNALLKIVP